jgi:glycosyltransferase involved in cell wall biosynthesis
MVSSGAQPSFAVIVPAYDNAATLRRSAGSVPAGARGDVELVVVDDASTDATPRICAELATAGATTLRQPTNRGPAAARNLGARASHADWLVFLDADDALVPGWHGVLLDALGTGADPDDRACGLLEAAHLLGDAPTPRHGFLAGTFAVRRDVFETAGGYDEALRFAESSELRWRLDDALVAARLRTVTVDRPIVAIGAAGRSRDYDRARIDAAMRILETHAARMAASPLERSQHEAIVAVNAARLGEWPVALRYAFRASRSAPSDLRHHARLLAYCVRLRPGGSRRRAAS